LRKPRPGINTMAGFAVVVIIIAAAFFVEIPRVSTTTSTSTSIVISSSSTTSSSSSASGPSTGTLSIKIAQPLFAAQNVNVTVDVSLSSIGTVSGNYTFSASGLPTGVTATFKPSAVSLPAALHSAVAMTLSASASAPVANSTVTVQATAGSSVFSAPFPLQSVQALVIIQGNAFNPSSLTVPVGTKVYWLNLDAGGGEANAGTGGHDVTALDHSFSSGTGNLAQYSIYGHAFTAAGTVQYESAAQPSMTAQVVVTG
jgi:plastocyanin